MDAPNIQIYKKLFSVLTFHNIILYFIQLNITNKPFWIILFLTYILNILITLVSGFFMKFNYCIYQTANLRKIK